MFPIGDDNSQRRLFPIVTWLLVVLNLFVFFLELSGGDEFIMMWSFIPARFMQDPAGNFITLFTSMFMHAGWLHLGGNMLYLIIFGDNVEDRFGHFKFLLFYIICGIFAMLAQLVVAPSVTIPNLGCVWCHCRGAGSVPCSLSKAAGAGTAWLVDRAPAGAHRHRWLDTAAAPQRFQHVRYSSRGKRRRCLHGAYRRLFWRNDPFFLLPQPGPSSAPQLPGMTRHVNRGI